MAGGIKGITVEIGGDTTKLGKALKNVESQSKSLQRELKGVNSLLKMDPTNVTLLKQKQDLLTKSISQTKDKLTALKEAQAKIDSGEVEVSEEAYRDLQREIASTEIKLKDLKQEQRNFGSVAKQELDVVGEKFKDVGGKVSAVGEKFTALSAVTGAVLGGSTKLASDFENGVAKVGTVADTSQVSLEQLSNDMLQLSTDTGKSANEITDATYQAISASISTADAVGFVGTASNLAKSGFLETADAVDVLTTIINGYGLSADDATVISDKLIQTQNDGKTTVNELSQSVGKVIPLASAYGVNIDNLCTSYAQLTKNGIATAEAGTYMKSMLTELGDSGSDVSEILTEKTGKSFSDLMADGKSLGDVLQIIMDSCEGNTTEFANLWSSTEAGTGALSLVQAGAEGFNTELNKMDQSTGNVNKALETLSTPSEDAKKSLNAVKNAGITLGETVLVAITPTLKKLTTFIQDLATKFNALSPGVKQAIVIALAVVTALGPVLIIIGKVITAVGTIIQVIGLIANPVGLVVVAIMALVAVFVYLWNNCESFREFWIGLWEKITGVITTAVEGIKGFFTGIGEKFTEVKTKLTETAGQIKESITEKFNGIKENMSTAMDTAKEYVGGKLSEIKQSYEEHGGGIKGAVFATMEGVKQYFSVGYDAVNTLTGGRLGELVTKVGTKMSEIKTSVSTKLDQVKTAFNTKMEEAKTYASNKLLLIKQAYDSNGGGIKGIVSGMFTAIKTFYSVGYDAMNTLTGGKLGEIAGKFTTKMGEIKTTVSTKLNEVKTNFTTNLGNAYSTVTSKLGDIKGHFDTKMGEIKSTVAEKLGGVFNDFSSNLGSAGSIVTSKLGEIATAFSSKMGEAKGFVTSAIESIKGAFNFEWSLPHLNLPHIHVSGGEAPFGIGGKGSLPSFSVEWYKKAMDNPFIFNKPTVIPTLSGLKGFGDAGSEIVLGKNTLLNMVSDAVESTDHTGALISKLDEIEKKLGRLQVVLDTGTLVGETVDMYDQALGNNQILKARGV